MVELNSRADSLKADIGLYQIGKVLSRRGARDGRGGRILKRAGIVHELQTQVFQRGVATPRL